VIKIRQMFIQAKTKELLFSVIDQVEFTFELMECEIVDIHIDTMNNLAVINYNFYN